MTRVLPVPAPARMQTGPAVSSTASRWAGFRSWVRNLGCTAAHSATLPRRSGRRVHSTSGRLNRQPTRTRADRAEEAADPPRELGAGLPTYCAVGRLRQGHQCASLFTCSGVADANDVGGLSRRCTRIAIFVSVGGTPRDGILEMMRSALKARLVRNGSS